MKRALAWGAMLLALALLLPTPGRAQEAATPRTARIPLRAAATLGTFPEGNAFTLRSLGGSFVSEPVATEWEWMALAATWAEPLPASLQLRLEVRVSDDGSAWSPWYELPLLSEDRPDGQGARASELLFAQGRVAQLRAHYLNPQGLSLRLDDLALTLLDTRPGPTAAQLAATHSPDDGPPIITRAQWGANESYRFDSNGDEIWPRTYHTLRAFFIHHTASSPSSPDPAAAVRAIYYYHAVTNGWGDIGYHYVVDQFGNVYQGRFGTEQNGLVVQGGHTLDYNQHTMGISVIGNFASVAPNASSQNALKSLLVARASQYGIDPLQSVWLNNRTFPYRINGHRDSHSPPRTTCPGDAFYALLPAIRTYVAQQLSSGPPVVALAEPANYSTLSGMVTLQANASANVTRVAYFLDNSFVGESNSAPWALTVDAASLPAGNWVLRATGYKGDGTPASDERFVTIAPVSAAALTPTPLPPPTATPPTVPASATPYPRGPFAMFMPAVSKAEPLALLCTPLPVSNGAFEGNGGWLTLLGDVAARFSTEQKLTGARSLRAGLDAADNRSAWSSARLPITIPPDSLTSTLTLAYLPKSGSVEDGDRHYLGLLDSNGSYEVSLVPSGRYDAPTWQRVSVDMNPYRGRTMYLYFGTRNDGIGNSSRLYVDDVQLTLCRAP